MDERDFREEPRLDEVDVLEQVAAVVAHGQVEGAVEAALLLTQPTHLVVP